MRFLLLFSLLALVTPRAARTQARAPETGFLDRTVSVGGRAHRYQVYVPSSYTAAQRWPVILFLHGGGERGSDGLLQTQVGLGSAIREKASRVPAIVVFPQLPPDSAWTGGIAQMAMAALDQTMRELATDPARVYLTGMSMGGHGTWYLAYRHPTRFAAIAPICAWVSGGFAKGYEPVVPHDSSAVYDALARRIKSIPTWIFHGENDDVVPVNESRRAFEALTAAGAPVQYTEFHGIGHNSWDPAYRSARFWTWLFAQRRDLKRAATGRPG